MCVLDSLSQGVMQLQKDTPSYRWANMHRHGSQRILRLAKQMLPKFMLGGTPDAPSTGTILAKEQIPESHLHPLYTVKVVLILDEILHSKSIPTAPDVHI